MMFKLKATVEEARLLLAGLLLEETISNCNLSMGERAESPLQS